LKNALLFIQIKLLIIICLKSIRNALLGAKREENEFMTARKKIYKCQVCGNIVEVLHEGVGELVCCGKPMELQQENTVDAAKEKHVPVVERIDRALRIKVGSIPHPSTQEHYIEWIEIIADGKAYRQFLNPGDAPEATFEIDAKQVAARAYCNLHGLWKD